MNFIVDIVLLGVLIFVIVGASRKGFVSTLLDTLSTAISAVASYLLCKPVAEAVYNIAIHDLVRKRFIRVLDDMASGLSVREKVLSMVDGLPPMAVKIAEAVGVNIDSAASSILISGPIDNEQLADLVIEKIGYSIMIAITEILVFIALFIVMALLIRFISKFFENVNKIPFIGKINALLGGVIGIVKAVIIVFFICIILFFVVSASEDNVVVDAVNSSAVYNFIIQNNPVMDLFK